MEVLRCNMQIKEKLVITAERRLALCLGLLLLVAVVSLANSNIVAAEGQFRAPIIVTDLSSGTFSMAITDLDKDGDADIVVASSINDMVTWYENRGATGETWISHSVSSVTDGVVGVKVADIDRDGDADIVSVSTLDDKLRWHENLLGNGVLWSDHTIGVDIDGVIGLVVEDFDQDLDWDIAAVSNLDNQILWFENTTGDASDGMVHLIAENALGAFPLEKGDLDGDGDQDLISGWSSVGVLAWHENVKNQGGSWVTHVLGSNLGNIRSIAVDDINGDGSLDVLVASSDLDSIFWFQSIDMSEGIWQRYSVTTSLDGVLFIDTADVNNDGAIDVLAAADLERTFVVFYNGSGVGSNWNASVVSSASLGGVHQNITNGPRTIRPADVNGDGLLDIVTGSYWGQTVAVLIQQAPTPSNVAPTNAGSESTPTSTPTATAVPVGPSQVGSQGVVRPVPVVTAEDDITRVEALNGIIRVVHPTAPVTINGLGECASVGISQPSWKSTFQVKLTFGDSESMPVRIREQSLCSLDIEAYDSQAVKRAEMLLWQPATITIPISDSIIQQVSGHGVDGIDGIMNAIADRRLIFMKRHQAEATHWVPIATHMNFLEKSVTTNQTNLTGTYALMLLDEPMPLGYVLPSVGVTAVPSIVNVFGGVGFLVILVGVIFWIRCSRRYRFD